MDGSKSFAENPDPRQRLVIFVGPHKSASSSIQEFLVQYAAGRRKTRKLQAFQHWRWPHIESKRATARKIFARLLLESPLDTPEETRQLRANILDAIVQTWNKPKRIILPKNHSSSIPAAADEAAASMNTLMTPQTGSGTNSGSNYNVVLASEEFDRFGDTKWSKRNGMKVIQEIVESVNPPRFDLVVNYRAPRYEHWISVWKQLTLVHAKHLEHPELSQHNATYPNFVCHDERTWEYLNCVSNPLGLVQELRRHEWNVTLIDMGGVSAKGLDIAHTSACHVLGVPCTNDGWVKGISQTLSINHKSRDLDFLSPQHVQEMEWLFRKRDCAYMTQLQNDPGVTILFPHSIWKDCIHPTPENNNHAVDSSLQEYQGQISKIYDQLRNTTFLLELLQSQFTCSKIGINGAILKDDRESSIINASQWIQSVAHILDGQPQPNFFLHELNHTGASSTGESAKEETNLHRLTNGGLNYMRTSQKNENDSLTKPTSNVQVRGLSQQRATEDYNLVALKYFFISAGVALFVIYCRAQKANQRNKKQRQLQKFRTITAESAH